MSYLAAKTFNWKRIPEADNGVPNRFAKNFIEVCPDIALLSDLLGHDSIETTRIYLRRSSREQYRIVNQVVNW